MFCCETILDRAVMKNWNFDETKIWKPLCSGDSVIGLAMFLASSFCTNSLQSQ